MASRPSLSTVSDEGAGRVEGRLETDAALGERAGLVGDQDVHVAQVLDAHQPLDEDLAPRQLP